MTFIIFGSSGFIGKNLVLKLQKENLDYILINRKDLEDLNEIKSKLINLNNITIIYLIHDFENNYNNITIIKNIIKFIKNNIIIDKFIYLSSWVTTFNMSDYKNDDYIIVKNIIEKYLKKIKKFPIIIIRPPLVIGKNSQFQPYINILSLSVSPYFIHVDELSHIIIHANINEKKYNTPSYLFNNHKFFKKIDCVITRNIVPKSFAFFFKEVIFPISDNILSKSMITKLIVETEYDCFWGLKYLTNFKFVGKNQAYKLQKNNNADYQLVSFEKYSKILDYNNNTVTVQSGTTLKKILEHLIKFNKTIKHLPEYNDLSAGACIMTHIHGNSFYKDDNSSLVASCIKSITIFKKINNDVFKMNILNSDDEFIKILFNINYNFGNFCISEVEFNVIDNINLYKIYDDIYIPNNLRILQKYIQNLLFDNINLTVQYNKDLPKTLCLWKVSKKPFNILKIRKPSFNLRRHIHPLLRKDYLHPLAMEVDTYGNILCQYQNNFIEKIIDKITSKINININIFIIEFTCSFKKFSYIFKLLLKYNPYSIGIRFSVVCNLLQKKYPNLINNDILCWFEFTIFNKEYITQIKEELKDYIYFCHSGKYVL